MADQLQLLFDADTVQRVVGKLAHTLSASLLREHQPICFLGNLTGCMFFMSDLLLNLDPKLRFDIDFIQTEAYKNEQTPSDIIRVLKYPNPDKLVGRHIVLLDDTMDSGKTHDYLCKLLRATLSDISISTCVMVNKTFHRVVDIEPTWYGLHVREDVFLCGYGMDNRGVQRNTRGIYAVAKPGVEIVTA